MLKFNFSSPSIIFLFAGLIFSVSSCSTKKINVLAQTNTNNSNSKPVSNLNTNSNQIDNTRITNFPEPEIISRKDWNAKAPVGKGKTQTIKFITIHHSASKQKPNVSINKKLKNLQTFSQSKAKLASGKTKPAWLDIPYHFYIAVDGKIGEGREIKFAGDTNTSYDPTGHALIVLEGNFEIEKPNKEQIEALNKLSAWLANKYRVPVTEIKSHNDYTSTACPGKNLKSLIPEIKQSIKTLLQEIDTFAK